MMNSFRMTAPVRLSHRDQALVQIPHRRIVV